MFARIYAGIFLSVLLAGLLTYALYTISHASRRPSFEHRALAGTYQLISDSVKRQADGSRDRYVEIVTRLLGASQSLLNIDQLSSKQRNALAAQTPVPLARENGIHWCLPTADSQCTVMQLPALTEQQYRAHALLVVSELSRSDNPPPLSKLQTYSSAPLSIKNIDDIELDPQQISRLRANSVVASYDSSNDGTFSIFAPWVGGRIVVYGPIEKFQSLPLNLVITMIAMTIALMVAISYWLVSQLEKRLQVIDRMIGAFGDGDLAARVELDGNDQLADLGKQINAMASQVENLLKGERNLIQAVSHDFRTPLSRMRFRLEMLMEQNTAVNAQTRTLGLKKDIDEMEALVDEVLEHHKLGALDQIPMEQLCLRQEVARVEDSLTDLYPHLEFRNLVATADTLTASPRYINRLLQNLADNACKHANHIVAINVSHHANTTALSVEDDGDGIDTDDYDKIFNTFFRADTSRNSATGGYGLGLAIVRRIARLHHATISVDRSPLGGARFKVCFPAVLPDADGALS